MFDQTTSRSIQLRDTPRGLSTFSNDCNTISRCWTASAGDFLASAR